MSQLSIATSFVARNGVYHCQWPGCSTTLKIPADGSTSSRRKHYQLHETRGDSAEGPSAKMPRLDKGQLLILPSKAWHDSIARYCAGTATSFNACGGELFQKMFSTYHTDFPFPTRQEVKSFVVNLGNAITEERKEALSGQVGSLAFDETTSGSLRFVSTTFSWIDSDFNFHHKRLQLTDLEDKRATGETLKDIIEQVITDYGIEVKSITRDGAKSGALACRLGDYLSVHCLCHVINLIIQAAFKKGSCEKLTAPIRQLAASFKRSSVLQNLLKKHGSTVAMKIPAMTRWSSLFFVVDAFIKNRDCLLKVQADPSFAEIEKEYGEKFTAALEINLKELKDLHGILKSFKDFTDMAEGKESVVSLIPYLKFLILKRCKMAGERQWAKDLAEAANSYLSEYEDDEMIDLATLLDPRFAFSNIFSDEKWASLVQIMKTKHEKMADEEPNGNEPESVENVFDTFKNTTVVNSIAAEIELYRQLKSKGDAPLAPTPGKNNFREVLAFWQKNKTLLPILAKEAQWRLSQMASSAEPERAFSSLALNHEKHRNRLGGHTLTQIEVVREDTLISLMGNSTKKKKITMTTYDDADSDIEWI